MNRTIQHLEFLASRHDCVIVPGLGAVLAQNAPAQEVEDGVWLPPRRNYSFNSLLTISDGLVVGSLARSMSISHERAAGMVADEVTAMRRQLEHEGTLSLGRVGTLLLDEERMMIFEAVSTDTLASFAGWYPRLEYRTEADVIESEKAPKVLPRVKPFTRIMRIAAAAALLVAVGLALSTPVSVEDAQYASLGLPELKMPQKSTVVFVNNSVSKNVGTKESRQVTIVSTKTVLKDARVMIPEDNKTLVAVASKQENKKQAEKTVAKVSVESPSVVAKQAETKTLRINDSDEYCLVIASLVSAEDAEKFISYESRRNPGLDMRVLAQDGRYRIYAATGTTQSQALEAASSPKISRYKGVWVARR